MPASLLTVESATILALFACQVYFYVIHNKHEHYHATKTKNSQATYST